jgi:MFS family permease
MRRIHLIVGALLFIAFLVTGRLMRQDFPDKEIIDQEFRMLMRSRHIYILFAALIHLGLGFYFTWLARPLARVFQTIGSALLLASGALLIWAFFSETYFLHHYSESSRRGLYAALAGMLVHGIATLADRTAPSANASDADIQ